MTQTYFLLSNRMMDTGSIQMKRGGRIPSVRLVAPALGHPTLEDRPRGHRGWHCGDLETSDMY